MSSDVKGLINLQWDDPSILGLNSSFQILGVNVYRSFDSEFGPYRRVTELPVGATYWLDQTDNELIVDEDVTSQFILNGIASTGMGEPRYVFKTREYPIVGEAARGFPTNKPHDVRVFVDGVEAKVFNVNGQTGEVEIDAHIYTDTALQQRINPVIPGPSSRVTCTYRYTRDLVRTDLAQRIFYRVTTVGYPITKGWLEATPDSLVETPLMNATATNTFEIEKLDNYWREAIRRNRWILEQGGERARVYLRKVVGIQCTCYDQIHKQPLGDCLPCYGTGVIGGYEGPYEIILAPDDAERKVTQGESGRTVTHSYDVFTGPQPILSHRDFILKIDGDRYSIGPVKRPTNRGTVLQQHFTINYFDEKDIRYRVPVGDPVKFSATQFAPSGPEFEASSEITDNPNIPEERQYRGRTLAWKNSNY
jgi:predicted acetyltransferase